MAEEKEKNRLALAWIVLILGGLLQIGWSIGVDYTERFTVISWDIVTIIFLVLSMICMEWPMRNGIAFTTAYAVWIGVGVVATILVSAVLGLETITVGMYVFLAVIVAGVVGLKATPVEYLDPKPGQETEENKE